MSRLPKCLRSIRLLRGHGAPVLLYHATFSSPPAAICDGLHNVTPQILAEHVADLKKTVRFVSIDEFVAAKSRKGLAAVTFDDAYRSVVEEAVPVLIDQDVPSTIFVCGATLAGRTLWRDKVRLVINAGLTDRWEDFTNGRFRVNGLEFYRYTKSPLNNSANVAALLDEFLDSQEMLEKNERYCFDSDEWFVRDPLVSFGNHTEDHFVLSSLTRKEQCEQVDRTRHRLQAIKGARLSNVFSVPFGGPMHLNDFTIELLHEFDYTGMLLSRNRLNFRKSAWNGMPVVERFMPDSRSIEVQRRTLRLNR